MASSEPQRQTRYYSSEEKNFVREQYDLPLVKVAASRKNTSNKIRYFGLPGEEALDLACWGHLCEYVAAVEKGSEKFGNIEHLLNTQFRTIRHRAHLGDVDEVILKNGSHRPTWRFVSTTSTSDAGYFWDFDVIYLDYFGKFLPYDQGGHQVQKRAQALRHLFATDRQDAHQPWLLILTIEAQLFGSQDRRQMREFLSNSQEDGTRAAVDFLLEDNLDPPEQAARLVQGTLSYIIAMAASNADVQISPRPTVLYKGAEDTPMLHFAYDITPSGLLSGPQDPLPLLSSPLLEVRTVDSEHWFELLPMQPPGQTAESLRHSLDFLNKDQVKTILRGHYV